MRAGEYSGAVVLTGAAKDRDGDGFREAVDNCNKVFNPVRTMDGGVQADSDDDGRGDVCDRCPLDPDDECADQSPVIMTVP